MKRILAHPYLVIIMVTSLCLLAFWVTIPFPRVDNQLVGSDGLRYYVYLPSWWLDGDLDFIDEYQYFFAYDPARVRGIADNLTEKGIPPNQWPIGPAVLWSPFFLLAHGIVLVLNWLGFMIPADGYGYIYQAIVLSGSILYGGIGLGVTYKFVSHFVKSSVALVATLVIAFAGNLVYYMTAEPSMSHTLSIFATSLFFYVWAHCREQPGIQTAMLYGVLGGLMALIRPQDGLLLLFPYVSRIPAVWHSIRTSDNSLWKHWLAEGIISAFVALIVFSPQLLTWGALYGNYFRSPYMYIEGTKFYWFSPKLYAVLFSAARGLFSWHPVFLFALVGLLFYYREARPFTIWGVVCFILQWYIISSWQDWRQGDAFGGRMFIVCTPVFALGLALLIKNFVALCSWKVAFAILVFLLAWNFLLFIEYRFYLVTLTRDVTWTDLGPRRVTFLLQLFQRFLR